MAGLERMGYLRNIISLIVALIIAIIIWRNMGNFSNSLFAYMVGGAIAPGLIGFLLGFFGPLILFPSNQGPLLGIFITGPAGFCSVCFGVAYIGILM